MKTVINEWVEHIKYGKGKIVGEEQGKITVKFDSVEEIKHFLYPLAFEQFLHFKDQELNQSVDVMILDMKGNIEQVQKMRLQHYKDLEEANRLEILEKRKSQRKNQRKVTDRRLKSQKVEKIGSVKDD